MLDNALNANTKTEFLKLKRNKNFDENCLLKNMQRLDDIETVIETLQDKYQSNNTLMTYLIAFVLSHIP